MILSIKSKEYSEKLLIRRIKKQKKASVKNKKKQVILKILIIKIVLIV